MTEADPEKTRDSGSIPEKNAGATGSVAASGPEDLPTLSLSPGPASASSSEPLPGRTPAGTTLAGRYVLGEKLGEGGMGTVYRAEQIHPVRRSVAVKLVRPGMDSEQVITRFTAERQALAMMDHPNIAKVLDAGTGPLGQPFFVMELVDGVPLTSYCDARRLSVRNRLELFVTICEAVQHAHQKGGIHRDLKPSNILVAELDGRAMPKVIDFGLAKALEAGTLSDVSVESVFGSIAGTPLYMAPEQTDPGGKGVDTRTDIYALGVVFHELLTGSTPLTREEIRRAAEPVVSRRKVRPPAQGLGGGGEPRGGLPGGGRRWDFLAGERRALRTPQGRADRRVHGGHASGRGAGCRQRARHEAAAGHDE